ncbi:MAG: hypothetical protein ACPGRZ_10155 [Alphaproteobacteria bacterium]
MAPDRAHVEHRLVGKALKFWENARMDGGLPSISALEHSDCPFGDMNSMVIEVGANESEDRVVAAGQSISDALGRDPTGLSVLDALPSATEMGLSFCRASIDLKKPMADVGRFFNKKGEEILYRSILLPLSENGTTVDRVVTAFSYKVVH